MSRDRENLLQRRAERWQPPAYLPPVTRSARAQAAVRRFFDLQAGTVWRDLAPRLAQVSGTILDVGCGAQPYRGLMPSTVKYVGLDTADAASDFGYKIPDVLIIGEDGRWPIANGGADCVLATETLEHVPRPAEFLAEAARCLAPGGRLILTVPFAARWHYIPHDYWRYTPSGLALLLRDAGFADVVVLGRGNERTVAIYKVLALLLGIAAPQPTTGRLRVGAGGLLVAPAIVLLAVLGNLSLRSPAGDDTLGYTVTASLS